MDTTAVQKQIQDALDADNQMEALRLAREVFANEHADDFLLAWSASVMYHHNITEGFDLLEAFILRHPQSLHLPRVYLADIFSCSDFSESATEYARYYLRQVKDKAWLLNPIIQDGISRSFLLLTCVYTELGARSYSQRVLHYALTHNLTEVARHSIQNELAVLQEELQVDDHKALDDEWEAFFDSGRGAQVLYQKCVRRGFLLMAKRLRLLEQAYRNDSAYKVDVNEMLLLVFENDAQATLLS